MTFVYICFTFRYGWTHIPVRIGTPETIQIFCVRTVRRIRCTLFIRRVIREFIVMSIVTSSEERTHRRRATTNWLKRFMTTMKFETFYWFRTVPHICPVAHGHCNACRRFPMFTVIVCCLSREASFALAHESHTHTHTTLFLRTWNHFVNYYVIMWLQRRGKKTVFWFWRCSRAALSLRGKRA